jgi:hypothetical protein
MLGAVCWLLPPLFPHWKFAENSFGYAFLPPVSGLKLSITSIYIQNNCCILLYDAKAGNKLFTVTVYSSSLTGCKGGCDGGLLASTSPFSRR